MPDLTTVGQHMLIIKALDPEASVLYSDYTYQWYVSARIDTGGDGCLTSMGEHAATPEAAIECYFTRLTEVEHPLYLVTEQNDHRRHWRWNGAAFAEVARTYREEAPSE